MNSNLKLVVLPNAKFLGEKVDPFAEITVTEDGCLLYNYEMVLLERI